jgi:hypothetical protein
MAIAFPRTIPDELGVVGLDFDPDSMDELTPLRSGKTITMNLGPTLWRARYRSDRLTPREIGVVRAWYDTLLSREAFYGYDHLREYPLAHKGGWPVFDPVFNGTCKLVAVEENNKEITLGEMPPGITLSQGDYLAFDYNVSDRALHRVSAGGTSNGAGLLSVEVRPHLREGFSLDPAATVYLHRAAARMKIVPRSWSCPTERLGGVVTFEAIQTL